MNFFSVCCIVFVFSIANINDSSTIEHENNIIGHKQITNSKPFSMNIARAISYAYEDYSQLKINKSCLEISYRENDNYIFISIYSKTKPKPQPPNSEEIVVTSGEGNKCGPHFSYKFHKSGDYIDKTGIR